MALADDISMHEQLAAVTSRMQMASLQESSKFPTSLAWEEEILGNKTDFVVTIFGKKLLVVITQVGRIGSWVECVVDEAVGVVPGLDGGVGEYDDEEDNPNFGGRSDTTFETQVLFGARGEKEFERVYARRLMELVHRKNPDYQGVLLGIAMKDSDPKCFRRCMESVEERID